MRKDSKKKKNKDEKKPKESEFKKFLKKRAPIYMGIAALFAVFVVPEITKGDLESSLPTDISEEQKQVLDTLMSYKGPNEKGLSVMDAISDKIKEEYPNEKIYDNKKTSVDLAITNEMESSEKYRVVLNFQSYKGEINYDWIVDAETGDIKGNNAEGKHIIDLVDFYD